MERHLPMVRRLLATVLRGAVEDIADAEQEVLAGLFVELARFRHAAAFRTFLYRFCRNKAIDLLRREARQRRAAAAAARAAISAEVVDPDERISLAEQRSEVRKALAAFDPDDRLLVVLKDCEGLSVGEVSQMVGVPAGTVKSRLHRTREKLARMLMGSKGRLPPSVAPPPPAIRGKGRQPSSSATGYHPSASAPSAILGRGAPR